LIYFLDNCISYRYAAMLHALEMGEVTSLRQHYPENTKDPVWLPDLGKKGWTLISVDHAQRKTPAERKAIVASGAMAFYLAKSFLSLVFEEQAWRLVKLWPEITATAEKPQGGAKCFLVPVKGGIEPIPL
jgi:PIN domain-containing protein